MALAREWSAIQEAEKDKEGHIALLTVMLPGMYMLHTLMC